MTSNKDLALQAAHHLATLRKKKPVIHAITNEASRPLVVQALAAIGTSPTMTEAEEEVSEISSAALVINLGMPTQTRLVAMRSAIQSAQHHKRPWVFDTVKAGVSPWRHELAHYFLGMQPDLLRVNLTEAAVLADPHHLDQLAGYWTDTEQSVQEPRLRALSIRYSTTIAVSGHYDHINDGQRWAQLHIGHPDMIAIIGLGCTATALAGAFLGAGASPFEAGTAAFLTLGFAGEKAALKAKGPASFMLYLIDFLAALEPKDLETLDNRISLFKTHLSSEAGNMGCK